MGCWNGTCMISNLPIISGEKIKLVLLQEGRSNEPIIGQSGYVYSCGLLSPAFLAISGEYNDYGSIENVEEDWNYCFIEKTLKEKFGEIIVADDEDVINWTLMDLIDGIERGEPKYYYKNEPEPKNCDLSFVMIRQDVWDLCVDIEKTNQTFWNPKKRSSDDDSIPYYINGDEWGDYQWGNFVEKICKVYATQEEEEFMAVLDRDHYDRVFSFSYGEQRSLMGYYKDMCKSKKDDDVFLNDAKKQWFEHSMIQNNISTLRKGWMIQPGAGSQSSDWEINKKFYEGLSTICYKKLNEEF